MKRVEVAKKESVEAEPFSLSEFLSMPAASIYETKISKKALKRVAEELGLSYDESQLDFAQKILNAYMRS